MHKKIEFLKEKAGDIARQLRIELGIMSENPIGIILGTGWGDKLELQNPKSIPLSDFEIFEDLEKLIGHKREFVHGFIGTTEVICLNGRIHLNEGHNEDILEKVRLQTQILMELGVETLIVTSASGALPGSKVKENDLVIIDSILTLFAPPLPLYTGEFVSPEDVLCKELLARAYDFRSHFNNNLKSKVHFGTYAMVRGPFFESRNIDKKVLGKMGADIVGMSTLPECAIAALYNAKVLALSFVTNGFTKEHSHEENMLKLQHSSQNLSKYLQEVIQKI